MASLIKLKAVINMTGLSRSSIYALIQKRAFPEPVKLSERSSAWVVSEVQEWIESKIASSAGRRNILVEYLCWCLIV